ncbi:MAG: hypothetical protein AMS22_05085 [Thiotrichales bacterium SG8_50]|nr:MAG: hypothetical protein AMS22_05085 [Thiotrichales bacterium SG8_50]
MAKKKKKKWIQQADIKEGALTEMAKRAGFSTWQAFCAQPADKLSPLAKKRCILAQTFSRLNK